MFKRKKVKIQEYPAPRGLKERVLENYQSYRIIPRWMVRLVPITWLKK